MISVIFRTILFYFIILLAYRIMGKREIGQLGVIDLIVSILIAEIVALCIEKTDQSVFIAIVPISILVCLELLLGYLRVKYRKLNKLFDGKPSIIISDGKIVYKNMISQRYSIDDLLLEMRKKGISSVEDIQYAFLETNGTLSIFQYAPLKIKKKIPLPVIVEGVVQYDVLANLNKTKEWLLDTLKDNNLSLDNVFYALYNNCHLYIIRRN